MEWQLLASFVWFLAFAGGFALIVVLLARIDKRLKQIKRIVEWWDADL
jgi:hypothetical protein